jgi:hypothetical protein
MVSRALIRLLVQRSSALFPRWWLRRLPLLLGRGETCQVLRFTQNQVLNVYTGLDLELAVRQVWQTSSFSPIQDVQPVGFHAKADVRSRFAWNVALAVVSATVCIGLIVFCP